MLPILATIMAAEVAKGAVLAGIVLLIGMLLMLLIPLFVLD